jgi:predicted transcriptional regulator
MDYRSKVLADPRFNGAAQRILLFFADQLDTTGADTVAISYGDLAEQIDAGYSTVRDRMPWLIAVGVLEVVTPKQGWWPTVYKLNI